MSNVFVLDTNKQPLDPVHPGRARMLLTSGKAAVFKRYPFTIILKTAIENPQLHPLRLKIDPGSRTTGIALVNDGSGEVVFAAELVHRAAAIQKALDQRRAVRRGRRQCKTRYRKPRCAPCHAAMYLP
jgi:RRXRR protein